MSEKEFEKHYNEHSDAIFRYCFFKTSKREVAVDIMQDTFMKAWENITKEKKDIKNVRAFLYRIATNLITDYHRKKKSGSLDKIMEEKGYDVATDEHTRTPEIVEGSLLIEKLKDLPDQYRDVLLMKFVEDMSSKEIAEALGERENTISVRINRGVSKLRELYA